MAPSLESANTIGIDIQNSSMVTIEKLTVQNFEGNGILIQTSDNIVNQVKSINNQNNGMEIALNAERNLIIESEASFNSSNVNLLVNGIQVNGDQNYFVKCKFIGNFDEGLELNSSNNLVFLNLAKENGDDVFSLLNRAQVSIYLYAIRLLEMVMMDLKFSRIII
ncbi:right-handed parallel beta-helix repeat-containing protein [Chengkuizengella sediminis]|uniref:right-handed parallel beta-helix repeat-containing protein n=1 Tax=Chengkuizengella sediminis TaxID=1885917 RepID=UPI0013899693|nr:right-handed parallel beta-helix repeat-containing protein [Chengkuizengella sediminis]NDI33596.1 right-handed parallel beta-helix repeat-containing protein [Chengkuizengella sediminis]